MKTLTFTVTEDKTGQRIDYYLSKELSDFSRSSITKNIEKGLVTVNDKSITKSF